MSDAIELVDGRTAWQAAALLGGGNLAGTVDKVTVSPLAPLGDVVGEIGEGEAREARHGVIELAASGGNSLVAPEFPGFVFPRYNSRSNRFNASVCWGVIFSES